MAAESADIAAHLAGERVEILPGMDTLGLQCGKGAVPGGLEFVQLGIPPYRFAMIGVTDAEVGQVLERLTEASIGSCNTGF